METIEVPAGHGGAIHVGEGRSFRIIIAPCDAIRYQQFSVPGHRSCIGNLEEAMAELGHDLPVSPLAVSFFHHGSLLSRP